MCVAAAILGAGAIGAVGSIVAGGEQASGQKQAAQTQQNMFNTLQGNEQPYMQGGAGAESDLRGLLGESGTPGTTVGDTGLQQGFLTQQFDPNSLKGNPAYEFALQQGGQATRNADTPGVGALSGAALKDLTNFDVGTANQYESQYYNQFQTNQNNIFSRLSAIAGLGQNAAAGTGNNGAQLGTGIAQAQAGAAGSEAGGIVGATNALSGGANTLAGMMYLNAGQGGGSTGAYTNSNPYGAYTDPSSTSPSMGMGDIGVGSYSQGGGYADGGPVHKYAFGGPVWGNLPDMMSGNPSGPQMFRSAADPMPNSGYAPTRVDGVPQGMQPGPTPAMPGLPQMTTPAVGGITLNNIANGMQPGVQPGMQQPPMPMQQPRMGFQPVRPMGMRAFSYGGPVDGPGGPKDDKVPAMLSDGENVWETEAVNAIGHGNNELGQARLQNLKEMLKRGMH